MYNNKAYYSSQPAYPHVVSSSVNRHSSPLRHRNQHKPQSQFSQPIGCDYRSGTSRLKDINDQLAYETEQIQWRNEAKRASKYQIRSTSSDLKRSRLSENNRRTTVNRQHDRAPNRDHQLLKFQTETASLSGSRTSSQILSRPIISHSGYFYQQNGHDQFPSFSKQQPVTINSPTILRTNYNAPYGYEYSNFQSQKPQAYKYASNVIADDGKRNTLKSILKEENFEQFLDMDTKNNTGRASEMKSARSREFVDEDEPVSPVTYFTDLQNTAKSLSEKVEPPIMQTGAVRSITSQPNNGGFLARVMGLTSSLDNNGKIVTIFLVVLALVLVIFQLIR